MTAGNSGRSLHTCTCTEIHHGHMLHTCVPGVEPFIGPFGDVRLHPASHGRFSRWQRGELPPDEAAEFRRQLRMAHLRTDAAWCRCADHRAAEAGEAPW